jgi:hypothetical protein
MSSGKIDWLCPDSAAAGLPHAMRRRRGTPTIEIRTLPEIALAPIKTALDWESRKTSHDTKTFF